MSSPVFGRKENVTEFSVIAEVPAESLWGGKHYLTSWHIFKHLMVEVFCELNSLQTTRLWVQIVTVVESQ